MNPEEKDTSALYPATVYRDKECTVLIGSEDIIGWMKGERPIIVVKIDGDWIDSSFIGRFLPANNAMVA